MVVNYFSQKFLTNDGVQWGHRIRNAQKQQATTYFHVNLFILFNPLFYCKSPCTLGFERC